MQIGRILKINGLSVITDEVVEAARSTLVIGATSRRRSCHLSLKGPASTQLFTATIDWDLIEAHLPDMLRVALSVKAGRLLPSAILRRLATYSRKNRLYFAFRELGRAIRTASSSLPRSIELRRVIQAATNKSELFNRYPQWVSFGSSGLVTAAERDEQRKTIKYNHLVANLLIFHTIVGMTNALDAIIADGITTRSATKP